MEFWKSLLMTRIQGGAKVGLQLFGQKMIQ